MVDLHCHYLPGVDDGAPDLSSALALARAAVADGIEAAVLTPHLYAGRWSRTLSDLLPLFWQYRQALADEGIGLDVRLGAEVHLLPESLRWLDEGEIPAIGAWQGQPVVLIELADGGIPVGAMQAIEFFLRRSCIPMIAHPERNKGVMRSVDKLRPFVESGCLVQLTAASVFGGFGEAAQRSAFEILDAGWGNAVATDAHNLRHRPPVLTRARQALAARYGQEAAIGLTHRVPKLLVDGLAEAVAQAGPYPVGTPMAAHGVRVD